MASLTPEQHAVLPALLEESFYAFREQYIRWGYPELSADENNLKAIFEENIRGFYKNREDFVRDFALSEDVLRDLYGSIPAEWIDYERVADRMFDIQNGDYCAVTIDLGPLLQKPDYCASLSLLYPGQSELVAILSADTIRATLQNECPQVAAA